MFVVIQELRHCKCLSQVFKYERSLGRYAISMTADEGILGKQT